MKTVYPPQTKFAGGIKTKFAGGIITNNDGAGCSVPLLFLCNKNQVFLYGVSIQNTLFH